jgi:hypothetical protein
MQAAVVISAQPLLGAHDDQRSASQVVDIIVADLGNVLFAARVLPDAPPHFLHFQVEERTVRVPAEGDIGGGLRRIAAITQHRRQVIPIGQGDVLIGLPGIVVPGARHGIGHGYSLGDAAL